MKNQKVYLWLIWKDDAGQEKDVETIPFEWPFDWQPKEGDTISGDMLAIIGKYPEGEFFNYFKVDKCLYMYDHSSLPELLSTPFVVCIKLIADQ